MRNESYDMRHTPAKQISRLGALTAVVLVLIAGCAMALEKPKYTVLYSNGPIEYRRYEPYLVAETIVDSNGGYDEAGSEGFRRLFNYISGANTSRSKIAMTAPVERAPSSEEIAMTAPVERSETLAGWRITFMLPSAYTLDTAPVPTDERVRIRAVPARVMALLGYSGRWTEQNLSSRTSELLSSIAADSVEGIGEVVSAAYDPPFTPPFLRRNEVMIEVNRLPPAART